MAISTKGLPFAKGESRNKKKAQRRAKERTVIAQVRDAVRDRDYYCRLSWFDGATRALVWELFGPCSGRSEWSHYNATHRRSKTQRQEPELRHDRKYSMMLCSYHSHEYDQNRMRIFGLTEECCDGRLRFERDGKAWEEPK